MTRARDAAVEANRQLLLERSNTGINKYGTTLEASGLTQDQLHQHLLEELLDAANYIQQYKATHKARTDALKRMADNLYSAAYAAGKCNPNGRFIDMDAIAKASAAYLTLMEAIDNGC